MSECSQCGNEPAPHKDPIYSMDRLCDGCSMQNAEDLFEEAAEFLRDAEAKTGLKSNLWEDAGNHEAHKPLAA